MDMNDLLILAAGRGSRMGGLTSDAPKCLATLLGRPLLDWQLDAARAAGFSSVHIVGGYAADKLPASLVDYVNERWAETNMVASLFRARALLAAKPCLVAYSDIVYRPEHLQTLRDAPADLAVAYDLDWERLWRARSENFLDDAESFRVRDGRVAAIGEKGAALADIQGQYMGLLKFTPAAWPRIEEAYLSLDAERRDRIDTTSFLRLLLARGVEIAAVPVSGGWVEVDTGRDRDIYEAAVRDADRRGGAWPHDWRTGR